MSDACMPAPASEVAELRQGLHDRVVQIIDFLAVGGHGTLTRPEHFQELAADAAREIRIIMGDIDESNMTIDEAIQQLVGQARRRSSARISIRMDEQVSMRESAPYRDVMAALGECLNNAVRHSRADAIDIALDTTHDGSVCIQIRDNGCGLSKDTVLGMGLHTRLFEPAAAGVMEIEIQSSTGTGTHVTITHPQ